MVFCFIWLWLYAKNLIYKAGSLTADGLSWHKLAFVIQLFLFYFLFLFPTNPKCSNNNSVDAVHHKYTQRHICTNSCSPSFRFLSVLTSLTFRYLVSKIFSTSNLCKPDDTSVPMKGISPPSLSGHPSFAFFFLCFHWRKQFLWKSIECVLICCYRREVRETREDSTRGKWEAFSTWGSCRRNRRKYKNTLQHDIVSCNIL